ncbi:T9SS type A sorting domain-containing protein [Reichenbachiella sp. MSK19-1]|uniref:T9SS type A sorting domain-containing protein n=1 Tax=Reichenbachiella sp. MSK19-1 TaxID=1897631 RepID=UPI000E6CA31D|nr:T9SS type A sorting domain-containing protein [Reichenbachiella sp. MSK19-1]RJE74993.1 hypothetical protein BGP76_17905 [Reichenbachiella sp. MSK19-1]
MQSKNIIVGLIGIAAFWLSPTLHAQITLKPIGHGGQSNAITQARTHAAGDTLTLPFFDDFSTSWGTASSDLWLTKEDVLINATMAIVPPSINVATFDGVDQTGTPYSAETTGTITDVLESKPIDLSGLDEGDNVYLSFYWQQEGLGEIPQSDDSLIVRFYTNDEKWIVPTDGKIAGDPTLPSDNFQKASYHIDNPLLFHEGFKFKIESYGNPTGPYDTWHVDYILLDKERVIAGESIKDHAISTQPTSIFSRYSNIPFDQFYAYPDSIFKGSEFWLYSLFSGQNNPEFLLTITDTVNQNIIYNTPQSTTQLILNGVDDHKMYVTSSMTMADWLPSQNQDSLFLEAKLAYNSDDDLAYQNNDTTRFYFQIHETLAYDDGSAEFAAGINQSSGELAVSYTLSSIDTLTHVDIYFPQIYPQPDVATLNLRIYTALSGNVADTKGGVQIRVSLADSINRFSRFTLSTPIVLPAGEFFISLEQFTNDYVPYGWDKNTDNADKVYYKIGEEWFQNDRVNLAGSPMIRGIFADNDVIVMSSAQETTTSLLVYPNPAKDYIYIEGDIDEYQLIDLSGSVLRSGSHPQITTEGIKNGVYLIKTRSGNQTNTQKIIINR